MNNWAIVFNELPYLIEGLGLTLVISILALGMAIVIGIVIAIFRTVPARALNKIGTAYVEFFQNTPLLIQVFFFYYGGPALGIHFDGWICGTLGLAVYIGAYIGEVFRAGIQAVPRGQMEAARSSGMTYLQAMGLIILPQAVKIALPPMGNQAINLVKNSAVLSAIAVFDLMYCTYRMASDYFIIFEFFIVAALLYLCITIPMSMLVNLMERRYSISN